jgi:hypothetical protein
VGVRVEARASTPYRRTLHLLGWWSESHLAAIVLRGHDEVPPVLWHNSRLVSSGTTLAATLEMWARYQLAHGAICLIVHRDDLPQFDLSPPVVLDDDQDGCSRAVS